MHPTEHTNTTIPDSLAELCLLPTIDVAQRLLGARLIRQTPEGIMVGRIVETEAYLHDDPACHSVRELPDGGTIHRQTKRNAVMFGPPGRAYVYFTYGNHYMLNVVTQPAGMPEAVLIRAVEPLEGFEQMQRLRGNVDPRVLTNGPGKLARAFGIDMALNGHDLTQPPLQVMPNEPLSTEQIVVATRIGISKGAHLPLRFYEKNNPWVSRK